jgi:hypothetical protein
LLGDKIINAVWLIAICCGLGEVLFWNGANALQPMVTSSSNLQIYISVTKSLTIVFNIIIPIAMGFLLDSIGMSIVAIFMMTFSIIQFIVALFINEEHNSDNTKIKYNDFLKQVKTTYPQYKKIYTNLFLYGFCSNASMLVLYYTVITFGSNISLGVFSTIASLLAIIVLYIYNLKKKIFLNHIYSILSSICVFLGILLLLITLNKVTLIIFYLFWNITIIIPETLTSTGRFNISKQNFLTQFNIENITISEIYLDSGRIVGEIMLLVTGLVQNRICDIICLCLMSIGIIIYYIQTIHINKQQKQETPPKANAKN